MSKDRRMLSPFMYHFLAGSARILFRLCHPVIRIEGRENLPEGAAVLCANHSHLTDPVWIIAFSRLHRQPRSMAKKELFSNPFFTWFFTKIGAFPVDRGNTDIKAIKEALHTLKDGNKLLVFPEGTRVRKGKPSEPHSGAILLANKVGAPVVPIYLSVKKGLFRPIRIQFGKPGFSDFAGVKPDSQALGNRTRELMAEIYAMGEQR